jgi:hypothetical protein
MQNEHVFEFQSNLLRNQDHQHPTYLEGTSNRKDQDLLWERSNKPIKSTHVTMFKLTSLDSFIMSRSLETIFIRVIKVTDAITDHFLSPLNKEDTILFLIINYHKQKQKNHIYKLLVFDLHCQFHIISCHPYPPPRIV